MITITNNDTNPVDWYVMPKYDCDTANAVANGTLPAGDTAVFNTSNSQTVTFDVGSGFSAGGVCGSNATVEFENDPNGAWCRVS